MSENLASVVDKIRSLRAKTLGLPFEYDGKFTVGIAAPLERDHNGTGIFYFRTGQNEAAYLVELANSATLLLDAADRAVSAQASATEWALLAMSLGRAVYEWVASGDNGGPKAPMPGPLLRAMAEVDAARRAAGIPSLREEDADV